MTSQSSNKKNIQNILQGVVYMDYETSHILCNVIRENDLESFEYMINNGLDLNQCLHVDIYSNLDINISISNYNDCPVFPIFYAVQNNRLDIVKKMIEIGVDINTIVNERTVLTHSIICDIHSYDMIKLLLSDNGLDINRLHGETEHVTALSTASIWHNIEMIILLLSYGAVTNNISLEKCLVSLEYNILYEYTNYADKYISIIKLLLKYGSLVSTCALNTASRIGDIKVLTMLLNQSVVNINGHYRDKTPLSSAMRYNNIIAMKTLLSYGADMSFKMHKDSSSLCYYLRKVKKNNMDIVNMIYYELESNVKDKLKSVSEIVMDTDFFGKCAIYDILWKYTSPYMLPQT